MQEVHSSKEGTMNLLTTTATRTRLMMRFVLALTAGAAASITMYACGTTGRVTSTGTIDPPFLDPIEFTVSVGNDGRRFHVDGGAGRAYRCVKVTWIDSTGAEMSTELIQADASGSASGQIPDGAKRWKAQVVTCPPPAKQDDEEDTGSDGMPFGPQVSGSQRASGVAARTDILRDFYIWSAPIVPSDDPGANNLTYSFLVRATSWSQAEDLIAPIVAGGIGTPVPPAGECQGSCRLGALHHAATSAGVFDAGLSATSRTGVQSLVLPVHRSGRRSRAAA
jgi:hypothetical protein